MNILRRTLFALVLLALTFCAKGQQPAEKPLKNETATQPTPAKSTDKDSASKEAYVIELLSNKYSFEKDGKGVREILVRVNIKAQSAVREFGLLAYPYASSFESLDILHVTVRKPDGAIVETPASEVQDLDSAVSREAPMYTDEREKHIAVKSLSVGDVLEINAKWTVHDPLAPGHFWMDHSFLKGATCLKEILEVRIPVDIKPSVRFFDVQPVIREEGALRVYTFQTSNKKTSDPEKTPDWEKDFYGAEPPTVQISSFAKWEDVANWASELMLQKAAVTPEIKGKADELTKGKTSEEEKIRAIYDFVSTRFRYIGIDLGVGRYSPHAAADVLLNRYGDCKDKHTLFAALLQAAGISASPALISSKFKIDPKMPTPSLFDHVITAVRRGDSLEFLDATPEVAPYGMLLAHLRNRQALVVAKDGQLVTTPLRPTVPNHEIFTMDAAIDLSGTLDGKMYMEVRGDGETELRQVYRATPPNQWEELTQAVVGRLGFAGKVSEVDVTQPEDLVHPFAIKCNYHRPDYPDWRTHRFRLPHPPMFVRELTDEQKLSKQPLPLGSIGDVTYASKIRLPPGFTPIIPENVERKNQGIEFSAKYSWEKDVFTGTLQMRVLQNELPGEERAKFDKLVRLIEDTQSSFVIVNGKFNDPATLAGLGIYSALTSVSSLEDALANDPENDHILMALSNAYIRAGRPKDAVTALQKRVEDHEDVPPHLRLALGLAQLRVPDAEKAMVEFKAILNDDADPVEFNEAAYALAEANTHLPEALEYSKHAVKEIESTTEQIEAEDADTDDYREMMLLAANWDTFGWITFRMGDTRSAAKYLGAAWRLNQSAVIGEHLVEALEKLGNKAEALSVCNMAKAAYLPTQSDESTEEKLEKALKRLMPADQKMQDGGFALSGMRLYQIPFRTKLSKNSVNAEFAVVITNGKKEKGIRFISGASELQGATKILASTEFSQSFPSDTPARILRKGSLSCSIYTSTCSFIFMPIQDAAVDSIRNFVIPH